MLDKLCKNKISIFGMATKKPLYVLFSYWLLKTNPLLSSWFDRSIFGKALSLALVVWIFLACKLKKKRLNYIWIVKVFNECFFFSVLGFTSPWMVGSTRDKGHYCPNEIGLKSKIWSRKRRRRRAWYFETCSERWPAVWYLAEHMDTNSTSPTSIPETDVFNYFRLIIILKLLNSTTKNTRKKINNTRTLVEQCHESLTTQELKVCFLYLWTS